MKKHLDPEDNQLLHHYAKLNTIQELEDRYITLPNRGFPRLLLNIKDKQLLELSKIKHPEVYEFNDLMRLPRELKPWCTTINDIKVSEIIDETPRKIGFEKILGTKIHDEFKDVMMYGKNKQTLFAAAKRQVKTAPCPDSKTSTDFNKYAADIIEKEIGSHLDSFGYSYNQWYNHLPSSKQQLITPIHNYYNHKEKLDLTESQINNLKTLHYEAIVKAELQPSDGKPRMVCSIPQRIKYTMGPITWQLEEICAKHLKGYCGGKNLSEMANDIHKYLEMGFTKVVEGDGSAFDNSQDITLKAIDRYIYNRIKDKVYHVPKEEFELISNLHYKTMDVKYIINNKKHTYMSYKVLGTVFSGDCDTTLANTIRMALYNRYANDKAGLKYGEDYIVFSKGDDFSVLYKPSVSTDLIKSIYNTYFLSKPEGIYEICDTRVRALGQICKFLEFGAPNSFKFCSLRSWYKDPNNIEDIMLTRNPAKLYTISQYAIKTKNMTPMGRVKYLQQQAIDLETNYPNLEIFQIMAHAYREHALQIATYYKDKKAKSIMNYYEKLRKSKQRLTKNYQFTDDPIINRILNSLYDIKEREKVDDLIYNDYWDNVKQREQQITDTLTKEQAEYINQQINAEFDTEELKSLVGVINF